MDIGTYYAANRPSVIFYDVIEGVYRPVEREVAFYLNKLGSPGASILELGCGTGRIGWALAEAGHYVMGVDIAPATLERARRKAELYSPEIAQRTQWIEADITALQLEKQYDLVIAPYRVFDHITSLPGQRQLLASARKHLRPGCHFVFDTTQPSEERLYQPALSVDQPPLAIDIAHLGMVLERSIAATWANREDQTFTTDFRYSLRFANGETRTDIDRLTVRWVTPKQTREMLQQAGFKVEAEYQDFEASPPAGAGDRVWVVSAV